MSAAFCGHCRNDPAVGSHELCQRALLLEPPRYCTLCGRRMVVQVTPRGWAARCSEHGTTTG
ncbi:MAG: hypothetical protein WCB04_13565 [Mycobacteriales bacterium]